ncbi:hypothetical protein ACFL6R_01400 [Gemmatimonadota bacterium]
MNVTSSAHKKGTVDFDNLQQEKKFSRMKGYANTKLMLNLITFELAVQLWNIVGELTGISGDIV